MDSNDTKYQIFISSTYEDLKEERSVVVETILKLNHIPIGMEMFNAGDEAQWEVIKRTISSSDYYILIIGNRYGSTTPEGISYTEKEYNYAVDQGIPVLAFIKKNGKPSPDEDEEKRARYVLFKKRVKNKMASFWDDKNDLGRLVSPALVSQMKRKPGVGWIRATRSIHATNELTSGSSGSIGYSDDDKLKVIESMLGAFSSDDDVTQLIQEQMSNLLRDANSLQIRTHFKYSFRLGSTIPDNFRNLPGVDPSHYFKLQEKLDYTIKNLPGSQSLFSSNRVKVGFSFDKTSLDRGLLTKDTCNEFTNCIFNEYLEISQNAINALRDYSPEDLRALLTNTFSLIIKIDNHEGTLETARWDSSGIIATFNVDFDISQSIHDVRVEFKMPKPWGSVFEATLVDPTAKPEINLAYDPDVMDVEMYSYLTRGAKANYNAKERRSGLYDITVSDKWIYPKSGVVFFVKKKKYPSAHTKKAKQTAK